MSNFGKNPSSNEEQDLVNTINQGNSLVNTYNASIRKTIEEYQKREGTLANRKLKMVNRTGTRYRVVIPIPDTVMSEQNKISQETFLNFPNSSPRYTLGPEVNMNKQQRLLQRQGKLSGCIYHCDVQPVGQGRKLLLSHEEDQYPDPNTIIYGMYQ